MNVQVIITADNHLDPPATMFGAKRFERKRDHLRCFEEVMEYAKKEKPDLLLLAGDVFDTVKPSNFVRARFMQHMKQLHERGVKVVMVSGHHDTPKSAEEGVSPLAVYGRSGYAYFIQDPNSLEYFSLEVDGCEVVVAGLGHNPLLRPFEDPLATVKVEKRGDVNILLLHYPVEGFVGVYGEEPVVRLNSIPKTYQLVAVGHLHRHQIKRLGDAAIVYPGSTERVSFAEEEEPKGFVWAELNREGLVSLDHVKTQARPYKTIETMFPEKDTIERLKQVIDQHADPQLVLRLVVKGVVEAEKLTEYRRSELLLHAQTRLFHLIVDESSLELKSPEIPSTLEKTTPLEELRRYFSTLMQNASAEEREILAEALRLSEGMLREAGAW